MDRNAFFNLIKENRLSSAYLLHGVEEYVKDSAVSALLETVEEATRPLNVDTLESAEANALTLACDALPFFAERRVVICRAMPKDSDAKAILAYLPKMPETTLLLFLLRGEADMKVAFPKALAKEDRVVAFTELSESEAARWAGQLARRRGVTILPENARFFITLAGTDCARLAGEFEKLACYVGDGNEITREAISKVTTRDLDFIVFSVLDYFLAEKPEDGFRALGAVLKDGEKPLDIARVLGDKAKLTLEARRRIDQKQPKDAVIKALPCSPGYAYRVYESARRLKSAQVPRLAAATKALVAVAPMQFTGRMKASDALERALLLLVAQSSV